MFCRFVILVFVDIVFDIFGILVEVYLNAAKWTIRY
jgi:hypothetical protein